MIGSQIIGYTEVLALEGVSVLRGGLGVPVWSHDGIICTGETYKDKVKLTFAKGASLTDRKGLFNSSLDGKVRRAIDFRRDDVLDEQALQALFRDAVALNEASTRP